MTSSPGAPHLDNHHRNTLRQIFQHPVSHNIEWHAVTSLLDAIGTVEVHHDGQARSVGAGDLPEMVKRSGRYRRRTGDGARDCARPWRRHQRKQHSRPR